MFTNEPLTDFSNPSIAALMEQSLERLEQRLKAGPLKVAPIIDGREWHAGEQFVRVDPAASDVKLASIIFAGEQLVEGALQSAAAGFSAWSETDPVQRADVLRRAAARMRKSKFDLAALVIREAGKPWREADADVAEAIDFCEYYAAEYLRLSQPRKTAEVPGEDNRYFYQPRGIAAVIAPWNFPLAIACGMTAAALVTGNSVILKPAEQSSLVASELVRVLLESGVPPPALAFLPGRGEIVGRALVGSPLVSIVCFTGSKAVGLEIIAKAAQTSRGQSHIKRVIVELGGKNAIIVDEQCDLERAVQGVITSAFAYAGQKCSACSRLIVVGKMYEPFLAALKEAAAKVLIGKPQEKDTFLGPVIDLESQKRIESTVARACAEFPTVVKRDAAAGGFFVPLCVVKDVPTDSSLWKEEIFGPVLAARQAADFDEALRFATESEYALTGGVFSSNPAHLVKARKDFKVGNLYLNRACTGALVCRQPFGGFKMSGVGSKAGGPDYLLQFMEPRSVTERLE